MTNAPVPAGAARTLGSRLRIIPRLRIVLTLALTLMLIGTAAASAYWTATTQVDGAASAASVGLEQNADGAAGLATTYSAENLTAAGSITIKNVGSRDAAYTLDVVAERVATAASFANSLQVIAAPVSALEGCTDGAALAGAHSGGLPFALEGTIAAGETLVLCVQTSLEAQPLAELGWQELELSLSSTLVYAEGEAWAVGSPAYSVRQNVEEAAVDYGATMTCGSKSDAPWYVEQTFPENTGLQGRTTYRVYLARESTPTERVAYRNPPRGWDTVVRFHHNSSEVSGFVRSPHGGYGNAWVFVEKQVKGSSEWTPAAVGKVRFLDHDGNHPGTYINCGWR
jgi:hypothetical protein